MYASPAAGIKRVEDLAKAENLIMAGSAPSGSIDSDLSFELLDMDPEGCSVSGGGETRGSRSTRRNQHRLPDDSCL